jgi:membrane protein YqaA with SNARE-associated domain
VSWWEALSLLGQGALSAVWPVANAELLVSAWSVRSASASAWALALGTGAFSLGHTLGKCVLFAVVRYEVRLPRGGGRIARELRRAEERLDRTVERGTWVVSGLLLASSALGIPPLLVLTVLMARTRYSFVAFTVLCLAGRLVRFGFLAWGVDYVGELPWA